MTLTLDGKVESAVGGRTAAVLRKAFGIVTVGDLLSHYPRRYARRGELTAIADLPEGETVTIVAEVRQSTERQFKNRKGSLLEVVITDGVGRMSLTFFNQAWRANELRAGVRAMFSGKISTYNNAKQLAHPTYEIITDTDAHPIVGDDPEAAAAARAWAETPIPIYPATAQLTSWQIGKAVALVLDTLVEPADPLEHLGIDGVLPYKEALESVHRPTTEAQWKAAQKTLRLQEAVVLQTALAQQRAARRQLPGVARAAVSGGLLDAFDAHLPFTLTDDQRHVGTEIAAELAGTAPMNRLIQGEVGSGKTLVALRAMLTVIDAGGQAALLAPTEVLAGQHLRSIVSMLGPDLSARLIPTLLTGGLSASDRQRALLRTVSGQARIIIGTHALLGDKVEFFDLGLIVVDEQHRFGVDQREALRLKGQSPHVLVLTATPIPRTVAMTIFGDLDVSTIRELPGGRAGIESFVVPLADRPGWESRVWTRLGEELAKGHQAFVVCSAIDATVTVDDPEQVPDDPENEPDEGAEPRPAPRTVLEMVPLLRSHPDLKDRRIEGLHGRLSGEEKDRIMSAFARGEIDVVVATTVIEVGVDVPNASVMVVLDADRFGISQLHQLRGRVGRGAVAGLALFVTTAEEGSLARQRVDAVASTLDGFELAQTDLELRKEGDVLGGTQSGARSGLKLLRVLTDAPLIVRAAEIARVVIEADPELRAHSALAGAIARRLDEAERDYLSKG